MLLSQQREGISSPATPAMMVAHLCLRQCLFKQPSDMDRLAATAVTNLVAAAGTIGDQHCACVGFPNCRQQGEFGHFHRSIVMLHLIAETAGHAAAGGFDRLDLEIGNPTQHLLYRTQCIESLLMAMTMQHGA